MVKADTVTPVYGKDRVLVFRLFEERTKKGGAKLALQTKHTWKYEAKSDSTETKDGNINLPATASATLEIEAISSLDEVNEMLRDAVLKSKMLEVWDINLADKRADNKYGAMYARGYLQSWEVPSEIGKLGEIKTTMNVDQLPVEGEATLTQEQQSAIQYAFADTNQVQVTG